MFHVHSFLLTSQLANKKNKYSLKTKSSSHERWEGRIIRGNVCNPEQKANGLTNTYAECFSCVGTEKIPSTTPTVSSIPTQSMSPAKLSPFHHVIFRLHAFYFSILNFTCSSLPSEQKGKAKALIKAQSQQFWTRGPAAPWALCNFSQLFVP